MTMEQEQQRRGSEGDGSDENRRPTGGAADAAALQHRPPPLPPTSSASLHRALPSDPDLAARVKSVPESAAEEVKNILLQRQEEAEKENGGKDEDGEEKETTTVAALVREFLSSPNADATINRFLRAVGGRDAKAAVSRLVSTLKWRKEANPGEKSCEECKKVCVFLCVFLEGSRAATIKNSLFFLPFFPSRFSLILNLNRTRGAITCMCECFFVFLERKR